MGGRPGLSGAEQSPHSVPGAPPPHGDSTDVLAQGLRLRGWWRASPTPPGAGPTSPVPALAPVIHPEPRALPRHGVCAGHACGDLGRPPRLPTAPTTPTPARPSRSQARSRLIQGQNPAGPLNSQPAPRLPPAPSSGWPAEPRGPSTEEPAPGRCRCARGDVDLGRQEPLGQHRGPPRRASRRRWQPCGPQAGHLAVTRPAPFWSVLEDGAGRRKGPARLLLARPCRSRENCPVSVEAMTP